MAGLTSVSGLVSGLDTATLISQLMQIEAQSQTRIKSQLTTAQSTLKSLQDLNSRFASLATSAGDLAKTTAWNPVTVTSSSTLVTATAGTSAVAGPLSLTVDNVAVSAQRTFTNTAALTDVVTSGSTHVTLTLADGPHDLDTKDGTLQGLISALNGSGTGVRASTVQVSPGVYRLQVTSSKTGSASNFTLTNADVPPTDLLGGSTLRAGADAQITIGADHVTSSTNTFANVANGLTITLAATTPPATAVTLDVQQDTAGMTKSVKSMVDSMNDLLGKIDGLTAYDSSTKTSGPLADDSAVRAVRTQLLDAVYPSDGTSMATVGIQLDRNGKFTFDEAKFKAAYAADPVGVAAKFTSGTTDGFAARVQQVAKNVSDPFNGTLTSSITGKNSEIKRMQDSIDDWDTRLQLRQASLQRQFSAMETALSQMNRQSNWLSGQLGSLSSGS